MTAGQRIRELRGKRTAEECARAVGITRSSWVKYERGERIPRDKMKEKIALFFKKSVQDIFFAPVEHK